MVKRRYAIMTWNYYDIDSVERLELEEDLFTYIIGQEEMGELKGTPHIQAMVYKREGLNFGDICEKYKGCVLKAYDDNAVAMKKYCTNLQKKGGGEYGTIFEAGIEPFAETGGLKRTASGMMCDAIIDGVVDEKELFMTYKEHYLRVYKGVQHCIAMMNEEPPKPPSDPRLQLRPNLQVHWLYGEAGMGKDFRVTLYCFENQETLYRKKTATGQWWDNYRGEEVVCLEDFRGNDMRYQEFLQFTDPFRGDYYAQVKGKAGGVKIVAKTIFITSPQHPIDTWKCCRKDPNDWYGSVCLCS